MPHSKLTQVALGSLLIMAFFSCKTTGLDSRQLGHYENFSEADLLPYKGKVRVIPEHNESTGVIMAVEAVDGFKLYPLLRAFQAHPAKPTVYMPMLTSNYSTAPQELQEFLNDGQFKLFSIPESPSRIQDDIAWTRDWAPWTAAFKPNPNAATEARFTDFNYYELRNVADELPQFFSERLQIPRLSIPVRTEGGNFMINNRGDCLMTTGVIEREEMVKQYRAQAETYKRLRDTTGYSAYDTIIARFEALAASSKSYDQNEIDGFFRDYAGCKQTIWLRPSPSDSNQHLDLFAKFLADDTILVMELQDQTIATAPKNSDPAAVLDMKVSQSLLQSVQSHLNETAGILTQKGFKIVRAPLPLTMIYRDLGRSRGTKLPLVSGDSGLLDSVRSGKTIDAEALGANNLSVHMRSYANSLILKPLVYVPRFISPVIDGGNGSMAIVGGDGSSATSYPDAALLRHYEQSVEAAYGQAGLKVIWIDADITVPFQGSIHCLTQQIGSLPSN